MNTKSLKKPRLALECLPRTIELCRTGEGSVELVYVDQRKLPVALEYVHANTYEEVIEAIKTLAVRGAPAIGVAGAAALALWANNFGVKEALRFGCGGAATYFLEEIERVGREVSCARPTAVNLAWAVNHILKVVSDFIDGEPADAMVVSPTNLEVLAQTLFDEVKRMERDDEACNRAIGENGVLALRSHMSSSAQGACIHTLTNEGYIHTPTHESTEGLHKPAHANADDIHTLAPTSTEGLRVLTHCNAGSLATVFYGTALGVVYSAFAQGMISRVYVDETRPVGQGARLSVWELSRVGVPVTLICDNMAASLMGAGEIDVVIVGADRIAANGDVANKIGTYSLAVCAAHHGIPFYVAAPLSTIDLNCKSGVDIPIEMRSSDEVLKAPIAGVEVYNPAFDVTPAALVSGIITEKGVFEPCHIAQVSSQ